MSYITATDMMSLWKGRQDPEPNSARWHQMIQENSLVKLDGLDKLAGVALLGFSCDAGVRRNQGRLGAAQGPNALRQQLTNLPWLQQSPLYECGNIVCSDDALEEAQIDFAEKITLLLDQGHFPIGLGGGHEIAFASWSGLSNHLKKKEVAPRIGIINFDAHFDLRDPGCQPVSSGTPFAQIAEVCAHNHWNYHYACLGVSRMSNTPVLFDRADTLNVWYQEDLQMTLKNLPNLEAQLDQFIHQCDHIYLTIDLDVFPAAQAPGVSAPAARGVSLEVIEPLLIQIRDSGKLRLMDLAELNPTFDQDAHTARLAARLIHQITLNR